MKLKLDIQIPNFKPVLQNESEVMDDVARQVSYSVKARSAAGLDYQERKLPAPKDGGAAYNRSGQLTDSIGYEVKSKSRKVSKEEHLYAVIRAYGTREDAQYREATAEARREKLKVARTIGKLLFSAGVGFTNTPSYARSKMARDARGKFVKGSGKKYQLNQDGTLSEAQRPPKLSSRLPKIRSSATNVAVASILANPPKDKRAKNGDRKEYIVFRISANEREFSRRVHQAVAEYVMNAEPTLALDFKG